MSGEPPSTREQPEELRFFATVPRPCSYLEGRKAVSVFADPKAVLSTPLYDQLAPMGFRRSGNDLYRPACPGCAACVPVRVPLPYRRGRNQQRIWRRNADLSCRILEPGFRQDHFDLYQRYLQARHAGGGMEQSTPEQYLDFLTSYWSRTRFIEFREGAGVVAVAVTDYLTHALSAVYTFFEPTLEPRSLGTYAILYQLHLAQKSGLAHLYLGYWIEECAKMRYKSRFRPFEALHDGRWRRIE